MIPTRTGIIVYSNTTTVAEKRRHTNVSDVFAIFQVFRSLIDKYVLNYKSSKHNPFVSSCNVMFPCLK